MKNIFFVFTILATFSVYSETPPQSRQGDCVDLSGKYEFDSTNCQEVPTDMGGAYAGLPLHPLEVFSKNIEIDEHGFLHNYLSVKNKSSIVIRQNRCQSVEFDFNGVSGDQEKMETLVVQVSNFQPISYFHRLKYSMELFDQGLILKTKPQSIWKGHYPYLQVFLDAQGNLDYWGGEIETFAFINRYDHGYRCKLRRL